MSYAAGNIIASFTSYNTAHIINISYSCNIITRKSDM